MTEARPSVAAKQEAHEMRLQSRLLDAGHVPRDYFASERAARDWMPGSAGDEVLRVLVIRQSRLDPP